MIMRVRNALALGVTATMLVAGCAGSSKPQLSSLNPFSGFNRSKTAADAKPYPQKPSAFADPSSVPGADRSGAADLAAAEAAVSQAPLYPSTDQGYPNTQASYESSGGSTASYDYGSGGGVTGYDPNAYGSGNGQQYGGSVPSADSYDQLYGNQAGSQGDVYGATSGSTGSDVSRYDVDASRYGLSGQSAVGTGAYQQPGSFAAAGSTGYGNPAGATGAQCDDNGCVLPGGTSEGAYNPASVGDRYAHLYQGGSSGTSYGSSAGTGGAPESSLSGDWPRAGDYQSDGSGYGAGNTVYIPGESQPPAESGGYPMGGVDYSSPSRAAPSQPPYAINNSYTPNSATGGAGSASGGSFTSDGEYRPGSTKSYHPRDSYGGAGSYDGDGLSAPAGSSDSYRL